jgi:hypothetical protein
VDTLGADREQQIGVYHCRENLTHPGWRQAFSLRNHRDISIDNSNSDCLDFNHGKILVYTCKFQQENQYFRYDLVTQQIYCGALRENQCMEVDLRTKMLVYAPCNEERSTQKWKFGFANETMLNEWIDYGKAIKDQQEILDLIELYEKRGMFKAGIEEEEDEDYEEDYNAEENQEENEEKKK